MRASLRRIVEGVLSIVLASFALGFGAGGLWILSALALLVLVGDMLAGRMKRRRRTDERRAAERRDNAERSNADTASIKITGDVLKDVHVDRNYSDGTGPLVDIQGREMKDVTADDNIHDPGGKLTPEQIRTLMRRKR